MEKVRKGAQELSKIVPKTQRVRCSTEIGVSPYESNGLGIKGWHNGEPCSDAIR